MCAVAVKVPPFVCEVAMAIDVDAAVQAQPFVPAKEESAGMWWVAVAEVSQRCHLTLAVFIPETNHEVPLHCHFWDL